MLQSYLNSIVNLTGYWISAKLTIANITECIQVIKNFKNVTRCRGSRTAKSKETREGWSHETVKYTTPHRHLFHNMCITTNICRGLYTWLFHVIIPTLFLDGWYVVIKAYKFTVFEIWGDILVLPYIACPCYPYIRVYRLSDNQPFRYCLSTGVPRHSTGGICLSICMWYVSLTCAHASNWTREHSLIVHVPVQRYL